MRINRKLGAVIIAGMFMTSVAPTTSATTPRPCDDPLVLGVYGIVTYIVLAIISRAGYLETPPNDEKIVGDEDEGSPNGYGDAMNGGDNIAIVPGLQCLNLSDQGT